MQAPKNTKDTNVLANVNNCCCFTIYNFSVTVAFCPSRYSTTELPPLLESIPSTALPQTLNMSLYPISWLLTEIPLSYPQCVIFFVSVSDN